MAAEDWATRVSGDRWLAIRGFQSMTSSLLAAVAALKLGLPVAVAMAIAAVGTFMASGQCLRRRQAERERAIARDLPPYLDLLTVSIEAGSSLTAAMRLIVAAAPSSALRSYFERVLRQIRAGRLRSEAFASVAEELDSPPLRTLATALSHGEASGMSLGAVLRAQAAQRTAERFARAEKLAMEAPVKLLGPLILCIFPCTFIVLAVPIVVRLREALGT
jgi:tight adherence protein C